MMGFGDEPEVKATQTLSASAIELAGRGMEELIGEEGRCENAACPAKNGFE
jgi:hypothetical protein